MATELTTLDADFQDILKAANQKKGLTKISDPYLKTWRFLTVLADGLFKKTNKAFSDYVDSDGNQSSGAKGLSLQLSIQFEKSYGFKMTEAQTEMQMLEVARARAFAKSIQEKCMAKKFSRNWMKTSLSAFLSESARQFKEFGDE